MDSTMPLDSSVRAIYEDGFVLDETALEDTNPYGDGNTFTAILNRQPEPEHGRMVTFSCFWADARYDVDWTRLPDSARPIRFRHGYATLSSSGEQTSGWSGVDFGAQWNDATGANQQQVTELR